MNAAPEEQGKSVQLLELSPEFQLLTLWCDVICWNSPALPWKLPGRLWASHKLLA